MSDELSCALKFVIVSDRTSFFWMKWTCEEALWGSKTSCFQHIAVEPGKRAWDGCTVKKSRIHCQLFKSEISWCLLCTEVESLFTFFLSPFLQTFHWFMSFTFLLEIFWENAKKLWSLEMNFWKGCLWTSWTNCWHVDLAMGLHHMVNKGLSLPICQENWWVSKINVKPWKVDTATMTEGIREPYSNRSGFNVLKLWMLQPPRIHVWQFALASFVDSETLFFCW